MTWLWACLMTGLALSLVGHMLRCSALVLVGSLVMIGGMLWTSIC